MELKVSVAAAIELGFVHVATGLGVILMALFAAAGPGNDFVDQSAECRRPNGRSAVRFSSRVSAIALLGLASALLTAIVLLAIRMVAALRAGDSLAFEAGGLDLLLVLAAVLTIVFQATWIAALTQLQRTQATQLALPVGVIVAFFLISRLVSIPITPDGWIGPLLDLRSERSMLDFWWSVGGKVIWPWGNVLLLSATFVGALLVGIRSDQLPRSTQRRP